VEWLTDADCDAALFEELNDSALVISDIWWNRYPSPCKKWQGPSKVFCGRLLGQQVIWIIAVPVTNRKSIMFCWVGHLSGSERESWARIQPLPPQVASPITWSNIGHRRNK
jgi:hypothetical protein